jgi:hypothetical protein
MDNDTEELRACRCRSYRASWFGFSLYGSYLALTALFALASDFSLFVGGRRNLGGLLGIDSFESHFDTFRTWARLLACFGLAAAWPDDPSWRRRARLLLVLAIGDVALWATVAAVPLGLATEPTRHSFLLDNLRMALGWSRYLLLASLAADLATSAGTPGAREFGRAARSTAMTGAALWFAFFLCFVEWDRPWPLAPRRRLSIEALQLMMAYTLINLVCLVQAAVLTLIAARAAARMLGEAAREARADEPWADAATPARPG